MLFLSGLAEHQGAEEREPDPRPHEGDERSGVIIINLFNLLSLTKGSNNLECLSEASLSSFFAFPP
jgi:hypothetical protein